MHLRICSIACLLPLLSAACGGSPAGPSDTPPSSTVLEGQAVSALDGAGAGGVTVSLDQSRDTTTDADGYFRIQVSATGSHRLSVTGPGIIDRETSISASAAFPARVTLIPTGFDLAAFDEMFRSSSKLHRWTERPALVVLSTVLWYNPSSTASFVATDQHVSDEDVAQIVAHLEEGLGLLTGGKFTSFESVEHERPAEGDLVSVQRTGKIVAGRYQGVELRGNAVGFGQWAETSSGRITGGSMILDEAFDRRDRRRRLLRIHELGHALGYTHVTKRDSIMNPTLGPDVMEFDRSGSIIAFQRPPGNRAPDADPAGPTGIELNAEGSAARWSERIACRRP